MTENQIQVLELRRLLHELKDKSPNTCVRFRLIGEMWQKNFTRIVRLTEQGVVVFDGDQILPTEIKDLREVIQFELDARYQNYHPHNHYNLETSLNVTEKHVSSGG